MPGDRSVVNEEHRRPESPHAAEQRLSAYDIDEIHYYLTTTLEKFAFEKVIETFGHRGESRCEATIFAANPSTDYHVHFVAGKPKNEINLHIAYFQNDLNHHEHKADDVNREVRAEDLMPWLGRFFKYDTCQAHVHMHYIFPAASRQSKLFTLPLKTTVEGDDVEIDGVSLNFPKQPGGVAKIRLTLGEEAWYVEAVANKKLAFNRFSLLNEVRTLLSVIDSVLEVRRT
jgi:hypothetical protein